MMQHRRIITILSFLVILLFVTTCAFQSIPRYSERQLTRLNSSSFLKVGAAWVANDDSTMSNKQRENWAERATDCGNSETCGLDEAQTCLEELPHMNRSDLASTNRYALPEAATILQSKVSTDKEKRKRLISPSRALVL